MRAAPYVLALVLACSGCGALHVDDIPLPFAPEPMYGQTVDEIRVEGHTTTRESLIRASLVTKPGDVYNADDAARDYRRLLQLGIFTSIQFQTEEVPDGIRLIVRLAEVSPYLPTLSFKLTDENGIEIGPGFTSPNLFGRATKTSVFARFGGALNLGLSLRDSWHRTEEWYGCCYRAAYDHRERRNELNDFDESSDEILLEYALNLTDRFRLGTRFTYLGLKAKAEANGVVPPVTLDPDGHDEIPGLGLILRFDGRNLTSYPTDGLYLDLMASQFGGPLGGSAHYERLEADLRGYRELVGPRHSLAAYALLTLTTGRLGVDIPIHQSFHLGGANSVRGWPLGSVSGKHQWINTVEYWWDLLPRAAFRIWFVRWSMGLQVAAFADAGTAWSDGGDFTENWLAGVGVGARLTIPQTGFVRFDVAVGRVEPELRVALEIGGGDKADAQRARVR